MNGWCYWFTIHHDISISLQSIYIHIYFVSTLDYIHYWPRKVSENESSTLKLSPHVKVLIPQPRTLACRESATPPYTSSSLLPASHPPPTMPALTNNTSHTSHPRLPRPEFSSHKQRIPAASSQASAAPQKPSPSSSPHQP